MTTSSYWQKIARSRVSRRRAVIGGAGAAGAAAFLAACGGGSKSGSSGDKGSANANSKIYTNDKPEEPVKKGGVWTQSATEPVNFDSFAQASAVVPQNASGWMQSRLLKYKQAPGLDPNLFTIAGDLAESYEISPDGLSYTFKLRQGVKFHNVAPVNGRVFDAQDVMSTWDRFKSVAPNYSAGFKGVVDNVSAPDSKTVVFKINKRNAGFLNLFAQSQNILIFPREAGDGYDPKRTIIGTGPWMMGKYTPSSGMDFQRNPTYYESGLPYMDSVNTVFLAEQAAILAQFAAGTFYAWPGTFATQQPQPSDFKDMLDRVPNLRILKVSESNRPGSVSFGRGDNPQYFKDERIRKAVSLAIDRDAMVIALANIEEYRKLGLDKQYHLQNYMPFAFAKWWTDPRGKEMGDAAQWFQYDPKKAKDMISAAGFPSGFDTEWHFDNRSGTTPNNTNAVLAETMAAVGIRAKLTVDDYNTVFQPKTQVGLNTGLLNSVWITNSDPSGYLSLLFGPGSNRNKLDINDAKFNDLYEQQNSELDDNKRRGLLIEIYKLLAGNMWEVPFSIDAESYSLAYPFVRNNWAYRDAVGDFGAGSGSILYRWLDK